MDTILPAITPGDVYVPSDDGSMDTVLPAINPGEVYVPSDDGMSDILHNAGHAYTAMYLNSNEKDDEMLLEPGPVYTLTFPRDVSDGRNRQGY